MPKNKAAAAEKPAPKVDPRPRRRSGKAYGKPKPDTKTGQTKLGSKTIMGLRRDRFLYEVLPQFNGWTPSQIRSMSPTDLNREIESVVTLIRARKAERRGHGKAGRYQNFLNGPGRPRSARDAELRRAAPQPDSRVQHDIVSDGLHAAAVAATMIGKARKTKTDAEVRDMIGTMRGDLVQATQANVIRDEYPLDL